MGKRRADFQELTVHVVSYAVLFINEDPVKDTADKFINLLWCCASCYSVQLRFFLTLCLLLAGYHKMRLNIEAGCLHDYLSESLCAIFVHALHY